MRSATTIATKVVMTATEDDTARGVAAEDVEIPVYGREDDEPEGWYWYGVGAG